MLSSLDRTKAKSLFVGRIERHLEASQGRLNLEKSDGNQAEKSAQFEKPGVMFSNFRKAGKDTPKSDKADKAHLAN